jgi:hypothetical protein
MDIKRMCGGLTAAIALTIGSISGAGARAAIEPVVRERACFGGKFPRIPLYQIEGHAS